MLQMLVAAAARGSPDAVEHRRQRRFLVVGVVGVPGLRDFSGRFLVMTRPIFE